MFHLRGSIGISNPFCIIPHYLKLSCGTSVVSFVFRYAFVRVYPGPHNRQTTAVILSRGPHKLHFYNINRFPPMGPRCHIMCPKLQHKVLTHGMFRRTTDSVPRLNLDYDPDISDSQAYGHGHACQWVVKFICAVTVRSSLHSWFGSDKKWRLGGFTGTWCMLGSRLFKGTWRSLEWDH